jgi:hypothetical protein
MKIYNKPACISGICLVALGVLNVITNVITKGFDLESILLIVALFALGAASILRSTSQKMAKEDKIEERDERNRLIDWKSKSKAFELTRILSFVLMLVLIVIGKVINEKMLIVMGVGLAIAFAISMFAEIFTYVYYESKN